MQQPTILGGEEKIVAAGVRKSFAQQRAFHGLTRSPEEATQSLGQIDVQPTLKYDNLKIKSN